MPALIKLTKGYSAIVDDRDFIELSKYKWHVQDDKKRAYLTSYAKRISPMIKGVRGKPVFMHRQIMNAPQNMEIDHINGNGLDNRRSNLRLCTTSENRRNASKSPGASSKFNGVHWVVSKKRWRAIGWNGVRSVALGSYQSEIEAAKVFDSWALKTFPEFTKLNFPKKIVNSLEGAANGLQ